MLAFDLSPQGLAERRRIAMNATPGPWTIGDHNTFAIFQADAKGNALASTNDPGVNGNAIACTNNEKEPQPPYNHNAVHIAISSPDAIIAMVDEIELLRKEVAVLVAANKALMMGGINRG